MALIPTSIFPTNSTFPLAAGDAVSAAGSAAESSLVPSKGPVRFPSMLTAVVGFQIAC